MNSPPTPTWPSASPTMPPRRPPRPVSVMPIVTEYPPSIRNFSFDNESNARPPSVWSSDDDDVMRRRCAAFFKFREEPTSAAPRGNNRKQPRRRRRWLILGILGVVAIVLAAVLGGVLGSIASSGDEDSDRGRPAAASPSWTSSEELTSSVVSFTTTSSSAPTQTAEPVTIQKGSRVGSTVAMPFDHPFRVVAFLDGDGHLATSIWTGSTMESFPVTSRVESKLPQPNPDSPLHLIVLGHTENVYILYVDEDLYLCLATMSPRSGNRGKAAWKGGRLETGNDGTKDSKPSKHQTTKDLRVTFEVHNNDGETFDERPADRLTILYEEGSKKDRGKDKYTVLSTITPEDPSKWAVETYQLSEGEKSAMNPQKGSQGFVMYPTFKDLEEGPGEQTGIRIIWDLSNDDSDSTFGLMKCKVKDRSDLNGCWFSNGNWENEDEHKKLLSAPKPLSLAIQRIPPRDKSAPQDFVLLILDASNALTELYWNGEKWDGMRRFLAVEDKSSNATQLFTSVAVTADGHLFGIADGKLLWYERLGNWWEGEMGKNEAGWELFDVVNTTLEDIDGD